MRFAVVGTNFISREFVTAGRKLAGFSLAAVCSRRRETAEAFADSFGGARCLTSLEELAACGDVDAVYIASPNACHAAQAERMLRAGKHVLLEKPACPDREAFASLRALAGEKGLVLLEAMRPAFTPGFAALGAALDTIGPVRRASFSYCQYSSRYDRFKRGVVENAFNPALCNGALMDIGVYCIHALISLFGMPSRIQAAAQRLTNGLDAQGGVLCGYDGMLADLSYSKIADHRRQNEVQGEEGTLLVDSITNPKRILRIGRDGAAAEVYGDPDPEFFGMAHEIGAFISFVEDAARGLRSWERHNRVTEQTLSLMDEIRRQTGIDFINWNEQEGMGAR